MKRIHLNISDKTACSYYRAQLPYKYCKDDLLKECIHLHCDENLNFMDEYDAYIFQRSFKPGFLDHIDKLKKAGKVIVTSIDDDMWNLPPWNPANSQSLGLDVLNHTLDNIADKVLVTNQNLADVVNRPSKTVVCPNLIDQAVYPEYREYNNEYVRILWAGSSYHLGDINLLVEPLKLILNNYPNVQVLFMGDIPEKFSVYKRIRNSNLGVMAPDPQWGNRLGFIQGVPLNEYTKVLTAIEPDIALCPLEDNKFNCSKSNIKYLEYSLVNAATVGSDIGPYRDIQGLKVQEPEGWYNAISSLVENVVVRRLMVKLARRDVLENWSWASKQKETWMEFFRSLVEDK